MNFNPVLKGLSLICLSAVLFTGLSTCSHSESVKQYIADQINPFGKRHVAYALYSKINDSKMSLYFSIQTPRNELTFHQSPMGFQAAFSVRLQVKNSRNETQLDTLVRYDIVVPEFGLTRVYILEKMHISMPQLKGTYHVDGLFIDENSGAEQIFTAGYTLDPKDYTVQVSSLRFQDSQLDQTISLTKRLSFGAGNSPGIAFDVDLRPSHSEKRIQLLVSRLQSDTSVARPIWGLNPISGTIETKGYKLHNPEYSFILFDTTLSPASTGTFHYFIRLPDSLNEGVFEGNISVKAGDQFFNSKQEIFYIFPKGYPYFKSIKEAVEPLKYLTTIRESEDLNQQSDSLQKDKFDRFWLKLTNNNIKSAKQKISLFYQRAEDANFLFSSYKPGWKTDLGMIYIILGPPEQVEWQPTKLTWYYQFKKAGGRIPLEFNPIRVDNTIVGYSFSRSFSYSAYEDFWLEYRREWEKNN